ncbi:MAG: phage tail sheath family protein [Clostridia bacterium]|nr:phage tail sheath family protein [Clostridia bacterium]
MALGGGTYTNYNKVLPGVYINFVSSTSASGSVSDRGVAAVAMELDWGVEGEFVTLTADEFMKESVKRFGYSCTSDELMALNDLFLNAQTAHIYRLGESVKASCTYGSAKYGGVCGNNITIKISKNVDDTSLYDVVTYYNGVKKDTQTVAAASELEDNDFVVWSTSATLSVTAGTAMSGGVNASVTGEDYQTFLDAAEAVSFNTMGVATDSSSVNSMVASFTKRMREERGIKFQSVLYRCEADDMGVINVDTAAKESAAGLVWFVTGASAGCAINKSLTNKIYSGSYTVATSYTQSELEECIEDGKFVFHKVDDDYRVLADINSLVTTDADVGDVFKENQTVRIIDQIAYDDAELFRSKYLGVVPNDEAGRLSLWNDIVEHRKSLEKMRAIEDFEESDVEVTRGEKKTAVVISGSICPVNAMEQLYMTTVIE